MKVLSNKRTPYGFVEFTSPSSADDALKDGAHREYNGQTIRLELSNGKSTRERHEKTSQDDPNRRKTDFKLDVLHLPRYCTWQVFICVVN